MTLEEMAWEVYQDLCRSRQRRELSETMLRKLAELDKIFAEQRPPPNVTLH